MKWKLVFVFLFISQLGVESARILGIFPTKTRSHFVMYSSIMKALVARGHHVTSASHFPLKTPMENYTDINLDVLPAIEVTIEQMQNFSTIDCAFDVIEFSLYSCGELSNMTMMQDLYWKSDNKYDLFLVEVFGSDCFLPMSHKFGVPTVGLVSSVALPWINDMISFPENTAYIPMYFYAVSENMNFFQRLYNTYLTYYVKYLYQSVSVRESQKIADGAFGDVPSLNDLSRNISMMLVNSHFSINQARPWPPQVVEVGGLHIPTKLDPLPEDLQEFLNKAEHGVVFFGFGTIVPLETLPGDKFEAIIKVLGSLKQKVLLKTNTTNLPELPSNIQARDWFPQLSILCHPNLKVFISHGGLMGVQEAISCGVPLLGVPMFADQGLNLAVLQEKGAALVMEYKEMNEENFKTKLNKLLYEKSYRENAQRLSELFKDRPQHPLDTAIYWLEYVIKHKGAPHIRTASSNLTWYQYILLDIILFLLSCLLIIILTLYYSFKKIFSYVKGFSRKPKEMHTNGRPKID